MSAPQHPMKKSSPLKPKQSPLNPANNSNNAQQQQSKEGGPDLSKLTPQELQIYKKYGKLPTKKDIVSHKLKERKYFDSGDYAMYKAGKTGTTGASVGSVHPSPDMIPHSSPAAATNVQVHPLPHGSRSSGGHDKSGGNDAAEEQNQNSGAGDTKTVEKS
ncbi:hypothetical protein MIR68_006753 [Amoeboaphelidium protococcarum]|nr:hypothetical protein MIR68_006753 [Amoeboaphelidium protococcarum]